MKRLLSILLSLSLFVSAVSIPVLAEDIQTSRTTVTPQMTYVDYSNVDTAVGYIAVGSTARTGYNKITDGTIGMGNTGWGENKIAYLKVDASSITDINITNAILTLDVSGSSDSKRVCGYGVLEVPYTDWDDTLTYNGVVSNNMLSGTTIGETVWTSTKSSSTFETKTIDITDALKNDEDRIVTLAIYETAAGGGYIKNPSVAVEHINVVEYTVTYNVDGTETSETVYNGYCVSDIPDEVEKRGYIFLGWAKDGDTSTFYTTEQIAVMEITADTSFTAQYEQDENYSEVVITANPDVDEIEAQREEQMVIYSAVVNDWQGNAKDETNTSPLTTDGITLSSDGKLTVSSSASPQTVCIVASSTDGDGNGISKTVKVNIYFLKFDLGRDTPENGFTAVTSALSYNDNRGFGITGTATDNADTISGSDFGFKVKLEKGNVYKVTVTYKGTIKCEGIDSYLTGFERTKDALSEDTYNVAVFGDGIMDLTFSGSGEIDKISIEKVERTANTKPAWWTIGDSTVQQNGSWGYTIASEETTNLSKYPELAEVASSFHNSGRAGRQHRSYYTEGLMNNVLCGIKPGDVVSISGMGTNDSASSKEDCKRYNNQYIDAIIDMGGKVILASYTPSGNYGATEGKVYDSDNVLFKGKRTNSYDVAIREVYTERVKDGDENILGFVDIGQLADNMMSNDVRLAYNAQLLTRVSQQQKHVWQQTKKQQNLWQCGRIITTITQISQTTFSRHSHCVLHR